MRLSRAALAAALTHLVCSASAPSRRSIAEHLSGVLLAATLTAAIGNQAAATAGTQAIAWKLSRFVSLRSSMAMEPWLRFVLAGMAIATTCRVLGRVRLRAGSWAACGVVGVALAFALGRPFSPVPHAWTVRSLAAAPFDWLWKVGCLDLAVVFVLVAPLSWWSVSFSSQRSLLDDERAARGMRAAWALFAVCVAAHLGIMIVDTIARSKALAECMNDLSFVADAVLAGGAGVAMLAGVYWRGAVRLDRRALEGIAGTLVAAGAFSRLLHHLVFGAR